MDLIRAKPDGGRFRQIRSVLTPRGDGKADRPRTGLVVCREKPLSESESVSVPQTDTGRRGENPQVLERILVKELGKIAP